jgi:hypothetical protein
MCPSRARAVRPVAHGRTCLDPAFRFKAVRGLGRGRRPVPRSGVPARARPGSGSALRGLEDGEGGAAPSRAWPRPRTVPVLWPPATGLCLGRCSRSKAVRRGCGLAAVPCPVRVSCVRAWSWCFAGPLGRGRGCCGPALVSRPVRVLCVRAWVWCFAKPLGRGCGLAPRLVRYGCSCFRARVLASLGRGRGAGGGGASPLAPGAVLRCGVGEGTAGFGGGLWWRGSRVVCGCARLGHETVEIGSLGCLWRRVFRCRIRRVGVG